MIGLLGGGDIVLEICDCMLPCLEALSEELGHLNNRLDTVVLSLCPDHTSEVSSPGMASPSERLVNVREGSSLVAEVGADIVRECMQYFGG
jgi:hypothetical protein